MRLRARLQRLERRGPPGVAEERARPVEVWLPQKDWGGRPPGRCPWRGSNAVLVIYPAEDAAHPHADA